MINSIFQSFLGEYRYVEHTLQKELTNAEPIQSLNKYIVDYLTKDDISFMKERKKMSCNYAAQIGDLETLKWLRDPNTGDGVAPWSTVTCALAAKYGHFKILKWLRGEHKTLSKYKIIQWWNDDICPWDKWTCRFAADYGHLEILKWLRDPNTGNGICPWDNYVSLRAAENGDFEMIKWMRTPDSMGNVCKWSKYAYEIAVQNNCFETLKLLGDFNEE